MSGIFISYRRSDSEGWAGRLSDSLKAELGRVNIFRDIEDIPPGVEFDTYIETAVSSCDVLIAIIGPHWLTAANSDGQRRLDDPKDFTRLEIVGALKRNIRVIPTLVGNAALPNGDDLPEDIKPLVRRQTYELSDVRWADDCRRLAAVLKPIVKRESWFTKKVAVSLLMTFLALGAAGVWHWYDRQAENLRLEADGQRQAEEARIAQEKAAQAKVIREKAEKEEAESKARLAQEEAQRKAAINLAAAKRDAVNRAQKALAAAGRGVSRITQLVQDGNIYAKRAVAAGVNAGRYSASSQTNLEIIRRARDAGAKASNALRQIKDSEQSANQQLITVREFVTAAEQSSDNVGAERASDSAIRAAEKITSAASVADQNFQITRDMAQVAESALAELAASPGNDGVVSSTAGDSVSIISLTPPVSTTLRASAPPTFTVELRYTLASADRAIMAIYLEQYPASRGNCTGDTHRTNGGTRISISRGTRSLKVSVRWPGGGGSSYLGIGANLWADVGGNPGKQIHAFGVFPRYCFRVLP